MKKTDLNQFDVVKIRDGRVLIVLENKYSTNGLSIFGCTGCVTHLVSYNDDLNCKKYKDFDIVAICKYNKERDASPIDVLTKFFTWDSSIFEEQWNWVREDVKEMTISEIEEIVGHKIKIVKEEK